MILYAPIKSFCRKTGKEIEPEWVQTRKYICDYTGEECDPDEDHELQPMVQYTVNYYDGLEQAWYYDYENIKFFEELGVEYGSIFEIPFVYKPNVNGSRFDACFWLNQEWVDGFDVEGHTFYNCYSLEEAMRRARIRTIRRLLDEEAYTKDQLLGFFYE